MSATIVRRDIRVASLADLKERERIVLDVEGTELGLYFYLDEVRAWYNVCPHQGGPVCQGKTMARTIQLVRDDLKSGGPGHHPTDRNIVCPWHGFEFNLLTGRHTTGETVRLRPIPVRVDGDDVIVTV